MESDNLFFNELEIRTATKIPNYMKNVFRLSHITSKIVFEKVNDEIIDRLELFVQNNWQTILNSGISMNEVDFHGEIYVHSPGLFKFSIGDRILIHELVDYVRTAWSDSPSNSIFENSELHAEKRSDDQIVPSIDQQIESRTHYFLNKLLETANRNVSRSKGGYRYNDEIKSFASYFRLVAGPLAYNTLEYNLPLALPALSSINRHVHKTNCRVTESVPRYDELCQYLEEGGHEKVVNLSEDATRITGRIQYDKYTNSLVGFVPPLNKQTGLPIPFSYPARNASEIIQHFTEENAVSHLVNVVMAVPVNQNPPAPFCLLIYGTDNKYNAQNVCSRWENITQQLSKLGIKVLSISSDSDPRYNSGMKQISKLGCPSQILREFNWFRCGDRDFKQFFTIYVQDTVHIGTKLRNLFLKTIVNENKLQCGKFFIRQSHLRQLIEQFTKDKHNLSPMVLNPVDKQNFGSVLRICDVKVVELLRNHVVGSEATAKFLEIIRYVIDSYMDISLSPLDRLYKIWYSVFVVRLWRQFTRLNKKLTLKVNFLTSNTYNCLELNAHSMLLCIVQLREHNLPHLFLPNLMSSQPCESLFRQVRSFTTTFSTVANVSVKEILQRLSKIQLQNDIAISEITSNFVFPHLIRNNNKIKPTVYDLPTNHEILTEIERAKKNAMNDAIALGLIKRKKPNKVDFACKLIPYTTLRTKYKYSSSTSVQNHVIQNLRLESLALQNYAKDFEGKDIEDFSSFVEVFRDKQINKRVIVKKSSLCWLLRSDHARVSSDRLERVKANKKKQINKRMYDMNYNAKIPKKKQLQSKY